MYQIALFALLIISAWPVHPLLDTVDTPQTARTVAGIVLDPRGLPVADVRIEHTGDNQHAYASDAGGKVQLRTSAPALVLRKPGYRDYFLLTKTPGNFVVRLSPAGEPTAIPPCNTDYTCGANQGIGGTFCLPKIAGVIRQAETADADYLSVFYRLEKGDGSQLLQNMQGQSASYGTPSDEDVWQSVEYQSKHLSIFGKPNVLNARGRTADGKRWRYLGEPREFAAYRNVDEPTALLFDRVLDGLCIGR